MIADGASFNQYYAAGYYQYGQLGSQPYDRFPVRYACTTYMLEPVKDGIIGRGLVSGICQVRISGDRQPEDVEVPADYADVDNGVTAHLAVRHAGAAQILWDEGGTDERWAIVRLAMLGDGPGPYKYTVDSSCQVYIDDRGRVMGWYEWDNYQQQEVWYSPWGYPEPGT